MPDSRHFAASVVSRYSSAGLWLGDTRARTLEPLASSELLQGTPSVSPDGARIAYNTYTLNWDILSIDLTSRTVSPLIASARYDGWPAWTPSGDHLLFTTNRTGNPEIWWKSLREGWEHPLLTPREFNEPSTRLLAQTQVSPDGRTLVFKRYSAAGEQLFLLPLVGGKPVPLETGQRQPMDYPAWSPDGKWIAFISHGQLKKLLPGSRENAVRIRDDAVVAPALPSSVRWSRTGQILYNSNNGLTVTDASGVSARVILKEAPLAWDWSPDGSLIYAIREVGARRLELITIDPKNGQSKAVADLGRKPVSPEPTGYPNTIRALYVSPDGKRAVFAYLQPDSHVWMMEREKKP